METHCKTIPAAVISLAVPTSVQRRKMYPAADQGVHLGSGKASSLAKPRAGSTKSPVKPTKLAELGRKTLISPRDIIYF